VEGNHIGPAFIHGDRINRYLLPAWANVRLSTHWDASHSQITKALRKGNVDPAAQLISEQIKEAADRVMAFLERSAH
jgi:hypothetical protein